MSDRDPSVRWIGRPELRREDERLVRGRGRFVDTVVLPDMAHLVLVRSPLAHGVVNGIEARSALALPGVIAVLTAADLGGVSPIPLALEGTEIVPVPPPLLAGERVRFAGEAVAAVVAETCGIAEDAAELIELDLEPLPAVSRPDDALRSEVILHDAAPDNILVRWRHATRGVSEAFGSAFRVIEQRLEMPRLVAAPIETRGAVASYDHDADLLTVWLSSQDPYRPLADLSAVLGRAKERLRVVVRDVGGAFGSKGPAATEALVAAFASMRLGRPVKWIEGRSENFLAAYQGRGFRADAALAVDAHGRFLALRARLLADLGAYLFPNTPAPPMTAAKLVTGAYVIPDVDVEVVGVATNKVPTGPYRGAGRPEAAYVAERMADLAARELGLDPADIRRRNLIPASAMPYRTALGFTYDSGDYAAALDRACTAIGYEEADAVAARARSQGRFAGIGLAVFIERAGAGLWESGAVEVGTDGRIAVRTGSTSHGQGHATTLSQIVADVFGVNVDEVSVDAGDTASVPEGVGTFASRSVTVGGSAVLTAARRVKERATRVAARLLGTEPEKVEWRGACATAGGREVSLAQVARAALEPENLRPDKEAGLVEATRFSLPAPVFPYGAYAVAVEIDPATGVLTVRRVVAVDDAGRIVNPLLAEGQVIGSSVQGVGQALFEEMAFDDEAQPLTGNFTVYGIAGAGEAPTIDAEFLETPSPLNPLGAKGIGESGSIAVPAAIANAVAAALAPLHIRHLDPPYTPEKLWRAIHSASAGPRRDDAGTVPP